MSAGKNDRAVILTHYFCYYIINTTRCLLLIRSTIGAMTSSPGANLLRASGGLVANTKMAALAADIFLRRSGGDVTPMLGWLRGWYALATMIVPPTVLCALGTKIRMFHSAMM